MLLAQKRARCKASNYVLSMDAADFGKSQRERGLWYAGKLRRASLRAQARGQSTIDEFV